MSVDRRRFLAATTAAGLAAALQRDLRAQQQGAAPVDDDDDDDEAQVGPEPEPDDGDPERAAVEDLEAAERLFDLSFTDAERAQAAGTIPELRARYAARRAYPLPNGLGPACTFDPWRGDAPPAGPVRVTGLEPPATPRPTDDDDLAYASVSELGAWLRAGALSSVELTTALLARVERLEPTLRACITVTGDLALEQAARADAELRAGRDRGPLHGVPYGAKDLFDTAGLRTTFGAGPYRDRVPDRTAAVVERLERAGAVLLAKTSLGALAYGDVWFDARTNCPWDPERGSSGSSAGSCAGVAAGYFPIAIGTETLGSILSPCQRNGTAGLRPTFGRVPRTDAMALCWSLDKVGGIARRVDDLALVLAAISGRDAGDPSSRDIAFDCDLSAGVEGLRVGYDPTWFEGRNVGAIERAALEHLRDAGCELVEWRAPEGPWDALLTILMVEAAAAFEELTLTDRDDELVWQADAAWPNTFRAHWFAPAVELLQAERLRGALVEAWRGAFDGCDAVVSPPFAGDLLLQTNYTGHPCLSLRAGVVDGAPRNVVLWGPLGGEATLVRLGRALEARLDAWRARPPLDGR